ncbi:hypothetical protein ACP4OV_016598 [Aristida adscensionis]
MLYAAGTSILISQRPIHSVQCIPLAHHDAIMRVTPSTRVQEIQ